MDRAEYNKCMVPWMRGGGEDRKLRFCVGAKVCSGKANTEEEARQICLTQPPKERKEGRKVRKAPLDPEKMATCVSELVNVSEITAENFRATLTEAIKRCNSSKPLTRAEKAEANMSPEQKEALSTIGQITEDYKDTRWEDNWGMGK